MGKYISVVLFVGGVAQAASQEPPADIGIVVQRGAMGAVISEVIAGSPDNTGVWVQLLPRQ